MGRVTLQTLAERVGVSRMTVSNAFSRPDQLSNALRQRILAAADELGYVGPDPAGRALARGTSGAVGVLLTDSLRHAFTDEVATGFLAAVVDELAPTGLALTLLTTDGDSDAVAARDVAIDGALVYSCRPASAARDWLMRRNLPLVFVDQPPVPRISSVNVDDRGGARAAAQHLVDLGHQRVAVVTERVDGTDDNDDAGAVDPTATTTSYPVRQRMLGWLDALSPAGIAPQVVATRQNRDVELAGLARSLLDRDDHPTAVLCFSDVLALGVMRAAEGIGLEVPGDVSVVGFDDSPAASRASPSLTTVRQDVAAKGRVAAAALTSAMDRARSGSHGRARHVTLPTELVVRDSTGRPAAAASR